MSRGNHHNDIRDRLWEARRSLRELVEGVDHLDREAILRVWPQGVPGLNPDNFGKFSIDQVVAIESFVQGLLIKHDWVKINPEQMAAARSLWEELDQPSLKALEVWKHMEGVPNLTSSKARLYHWKRSMEALKAAAEDREVSG